MNWQIKNLFLMSNVKKWIENQVLLISSETTLLKQFITLKKKHYISELSKIRPDTVQQWSILDFFPKCFTILNLKNTLIYIKCKYLFWLFMTVLWKNSIMKKQHYKKILKHFNLDAIIHVWGIPDSASDKKNCLPIQEI